MLTLSEATLSKVIIGNVTPEQNGLIMFAKKAPRYNGENIINGSCAKIKCEYIDADLAKLLEKSNADINQLKTNTIEIIGNEMDLLNISEEELKGTILPFHNAVVMLKWVSTRSKSGWNDLKLVINLNDLNDEKTK